MDVHGSSRLVLVVGSDVGPVIFVWFARTRVIRTILPNPRRLSLECRRPRRLVATGNIKRIATFVPAAGEAGASPSPLHIATRA